MNLAISLRSCQSNHELENEVVNFTCNEVRNLGSLSCLAAIIPVLVLSSIIADLSNLMAKFKDKMNQKTYQLIFETPSANQFTSWLQL